MYPATPLPLKHLRPLTLGLLTLALALLAPCGVAQILQGQWVDDAEAAIDKHRKTGVTVIVLDQNDRTIQGAKVHLQQLRHDFALGLTLSPNHAPPESLGDLPVYRCFNAIALDRLNDWSKEQGKSDKELAGLVTAWRDAINPIRIDYGRVVSAEPARNTDKLSLLSPAELRDAVLARIELAMQDPAVPGHYDLYADLLYQDFIERKLGVGMVHRMYEAAHASRPDAKLALRVTDAIALNRGRQLNKKIQQLEIRQLPFDRITNEQRFPTHVNPGPLVRRLDEYLTPMPVPVTFAGLEVGGRTDVATGLSMETVLRLIYAQPNIDGIYFAGLFADELLEQNAALIDRDGNPTPAGTALDGLFYQHWKSDITDQTDERGNIQARVFTGWYTARAELPGGGVIESRAYIPKSKRDKLIVLQVTTAEQ